MKTISRTVRYCEPFVNRNGTLTSHHVDFNMPEGANEHEAAKLALEMVGAIPGGLMVIVDPAIEPEATEEEIFRAWGIYVNLLIMAGIFEPVANRKGYTDD